MLTVYLFGGKTGWIENFGEKIGRKFFLKCVWLDRKGENKLWGLGVFFPDPSKCFLLKIERKLSGDEFFLD